MITPSGVYTGEIEWSSDNPDAVWVNDSGVVNAKQANKDATITAKMVDAPHLSSICKVSVEWPPDNIIFPFQLHAVAVGDSISYRTKWELQKTGEKYPVPVISAAVVYLEGTASKQEVFEDIDATKEFHGRFSGLKNGPYDVSIRAMTDNNERGNPFGIVIIGISNKVAVAVGGGVETPIDLQAGYEGIGGDVVYKIAWSGTKDGAAVPWPTDTVDGAIVTLWRVGTDASGAKTRTRVEERMLFGLSPQEDTIGRFAGLQKQEGEEFEVTVEAQSTAADGTIYHALATATAVLLGDSSNCLDAGLVMPGALLLIPFVLKGFAGRKRK